MWIAKFGWKPKVILLGGDQHNQLILSRKGTILGVKIQIVIYIYNGSIATKDKSSLLGREFLHLDKLSLSPSVNSFNVDDL